MKIVLVGTSPAMLFQGILLSQKYNNIEFHEKSSYIGGSWRGSNFYKIKNLETGTHIFAPWKSANLYYRSLNIFKKNLKLTVLKLNPKPIRIINKNIKKSELKKISYYYVKGGASKIIQKLISILKKKKVKFIFNSNVLNITLNKDYQKKKILFKNKKIIYADKVYLPCYIGLKKVFKINNKKLKLDMQLRKSQHVVLEILNKKNLFSKKLSYIQAVTFSPFIDRISNLKKSHVTKKNLLCFRLSLEGKKLLKKNKLQLIKFIVKDLVKYFFPFEHINVNKLNFRYKTYSYLTSYRTKKEIQNLKLFTKFNKCNLVDTRELIQYTSKNIKKLEKIYG